MRQQGEILEHHGDVAAFGRDGVLRFAIDIHFAAVGLHQPRDDVEQRGFAAAACAVYPVFRLPYSP